MRQPAYKAGQDHRRRRGDWEMVIGMEVHAQVSSKAKLFSGASTAFGAAPNCNVSLVDAAMPGMLPVINGFCVEQAVRTGLGLKARINRVLALRPEELLLPGPAAGLPDQPALPPDRRRGRGDRRPRRPGVARRVRIERIHLEQDAGKSIHDMDPDLSFVDLNRTGVALMEIVSMPDIRGAEEAAEYVRKLRQILRYLGTCDGNMQEGSLRADVNVSVRPKGSAELGTRCEIKNMNSMRFITPGDRVRGAAADRASSRTAARSSRRPGSTTRAAARPARCAPRRRRTTTATSPTPTCCRWSWSRPGSTRSRAGAAGAAGREEGALRRRLRHDRVRRRRPDRRGGERRPTSRRWRRGATASRRRTG